MSDMESRITDADAELLLAGTPPEGRPGLEELAAAIAAFRSETVEATPRPSAELAARLSVPHDALSSAPAASGASPGGSETDSPVPGSRTRPVVAIALAAEPASRFGVAARTAVGVGALLLGIAVAGAAGALPGRVQDVFDGLVSTVIPSDDDEAVNVDEEPVVDDESVHEEEPGSDEEPGADEEPGPDEEPGSDDLAPEESASGDGGDESESRSDGDGEPGHGEEPEEDAEPEEPDQDAGEESRESESDLGWVSDSDRGD